MAEQSNERVARIEMALVMFEVVMRQQHLRDVEAVLRRRAFRKVVIISRDWPTAAQGLQFGKFRQRAVLA